jgi:septal ring factor EnvC (AmiA/AmiB activator)
MLNIYDQIQELRAELAGCILTRRERAQAQAELTRLVAEQAKLDRAFDAALAEKAPPD